MKFVDSRIFPRKSDVALVRWFSSVLSGTPERANVSESVKSVEFSERYLNLKFKFRSYFVWELSMGPFIVLKAAS